MCLCPAHPQVGIIAWCCMCLMTWNIDGRFPANYLSLYHNLCLCLCTNACACGFIRGTKEYACVHLKLQQCMQACKSHQQYAIWADVRLNVAPSPTPQGAFRAGNASLKHRLRPLRRPVGVVRAQAEEKKEEEVSVLLHFRTNHT